MTTPEHGIAAVLTARGRGAIATIAFHGDIECIDSAGLFRAANGQPLVDQPLNRIVFGRWGPEPAEEVVVCRIAENRLEVHCHGGEAAVARVLNLLAESHVTTVDTRAFQKMTDGAFAAEASAALAATTTLRTAALMARQISGPLRQLLLWLSNVDPKAQRDEILARLERALAWSEFGRHLAQPWRIVLFGPPNVGKSSLVNALLGFDRAIVYDQPGTTRDVVTAETAIDGWPIRFSDTAGLRADADELEAAGIARARTELAAADLCIRVHDATATEEAEFDEPSTAVAPLVVFNKCDLPHPRNHSANGLSVSAKTGQGIRELMAAITARLIPKIPSDDDAIPICEQHIAALGMARQSILDDDSSAFRKAISEITP